MKKEIIKGILLLCVLSVITSCNSTNEKPTLAAIDVEKVKKDIQAREDEFAAIYNTREMKTIGYYADDAESFFPNRPPLIGKAAIVEFLKADLISNSNKISFQTKDVFVSSDGNQVVEIGYYKVMDSTNTAINTGNYMSLFEKRDGKYVCLRDMSASDMPAQ